MNASVASAIVHCAREAASTRGILTLSKFEIEFKVNPSPKIEFVYDFWVAAFFFISASLGFMTEAKPSDMKEPPTPHQSRPHHTTTE